MLAVVLVIIFVAIVGVIVGGFVYVNRDRLAVEEAARARLRNAPTAAGPATILKDTSVSQVPFLDDLFRGRGLTEAVQERLERAGLKYKAVPFLLVCAVFGAVGLLVGSRRGGAIIGVPLAVVFAGLPVLWVNHKRTSRMTALEEQLPEALEMMANAMRAGYSFQAATKSLSDELQEPLGPEFGRFYDEQRLGMDVRTALLGLQERVDSLNMKMFVTAVLIQRETGGNLTELLTGLAEIMRERVALRSKINTLTAEPRLSGRLLAGLPVVLFLIFSAMNPWFMGPLRTTHGGHVMLAVTAVAVALGYMMMMKIADVDV